MRVLVTGGAGFVGSHVVDRLVDGGCDVVVLDNLDPSAHDGRPAYLNPAAAYTWGDVRDDEVVERALGAGVDAVCHQAARVGLGVNFDDVVGYVTANAVGAAVLLRALARRRFTGRLVLASSMVVYGEGQYRCADHGPVRPPPRSRVDLDEGRFDPGCPVCHSPLEPDSVTEEAPVDPRNVYAATKLHQEHLCAAFSRECGAPLITLRYHNVYGPRMPRDTPYAGVASIFRSALEAGRAPQVLEDGEQRRDFVSVHDVARANVMALSAPPDVTGAFNVSSGHPRSVGELARTLALAMDGPQPEVVGGGRVGDVRHVFASPERARCVLGFEAQVSFQAGVREFALASLREPAATRQGSSRLR
jgi:dTDP-L-rhamnose 4-epimerase